MEFGIGEQLSFQSLILFPNIFREELNSRGAVATNTWTITSAANGGRPTVAQKSSLEMKLHKLRFIELIRNGQNKMDAVQYARTHFPQFVQAHEREIQALMGALMFSGSRYCIFAFSSKVLSQTY